jgi:UDP-hydrolysing UDP-N-acetyl-D-glucosamine 2-epimerase
VIYHPLENEDAKETFKTILLVLEEKKISAIVSYPNADCGYLEIENVIQNYQNHENFIFYKSLERNLFLSVFSESKFIIGNSSAGIYEAATIKKPAINVGLRQKDRESSQNVLFCENTKKSIESALDRLEDNSFKNKLINLKNIYGDGKSSDKAYSLIKKVNFNGTIPKIYDPLKNRD